MFRRYEKKSFIFIFLAGMMFSGVGMSCFAGDPVVLTIRPEMLRNPQNTQIAPSSLKNLFAWPVTEPQIEEIEEQVAEDLALQAFGLLQLDAIFWHNTKPQAIVNGRLIAVGESVEGVDIQEIRKDSILLKYENITHSLEFEDQTILFGPESPPSPEKASSTKGP